MANQCSHYFEIDSSLKGICKFCEEERQFPWDARQKSILLKKGRQVASQVARQKGGIIPSNFEPKEKARILEESDVEGVPAVCEKYGIPKSTLYSWRTRRHRAELRRQIAVSEQPEPPQGIPHDLWFRRDGHVVQIYVQGKLWAAFSIGDSLQEKLTRPTIMALLERYLKHGTLIVPAQEQLDYT